jgi:cysteine desulfurase/selenocysteine lyase
MIGGTTPLTGAGSLAAQRVAPLTAPLPIEKIRRDFPILGTRVHGKPLVYLDNAATTQKPQVVIDALVRYYATENANIHRGVHWLSERATAAYEGARERVARFLRAASPREIVFTRGTTEAINLVAQSWGRASLRAGDEVLITGMEHHANIVP